MVNFIVNDMTCGHCESMVTRAIKAADPLAMVEVDLASHQVSVDSGLSAEVLVEVLQEAGYPPSLSACECH